MSNASPRSAGALGRALSIHLDALRAGAALVVFVSHLALPRISQGVLPLAPWVHAADDAVMAFFVLSGFVIHYTAATRERTLGAFAAARAARLYSVVVPALALTLAADAIGRTLSPGLYAEWWHGSHPLLRIGASLGFVNELWFESVQPFSNGPFWSIGYEAWYYAIFGLAFYLPSPWRWPAAALAGAIAGPKILALFPLWLAGAAAERFRHRVPERVGWALVVLSVAGYAAYRLSGLGALAYWWGDDAIVRHLGAGWSRHLPSKLVMGAFMACHLLGFAAVQHRVSLDRIARPVRWLAGMTFSLYLFHYPLLHLAASIWPGPLDSPLRVLGIGVLVFGMVALLARVTERRKDIARRVVDAAVGLFSPLSRPSRPRGPRAA